MWHHLLINKYAGLRISLRFIETHVIRFFCWFHASEAIIFQFLAILAHVAIYTRKYRRRARDLGFLPNIVGSAAFGSDLLGIIMGCFTFSGLQLLLPSAQ
jgi:hypothetical protein